MNADTREKNFWALANALSAASRFEKTNLIGGLYAKSTAKKKKTARLPLSSLHPNHHTLRPAGTLKGNRLICKLT
jgi:hypothetical protein